MPLGKGLEGPGKGKVSLGKGLEGLVEGKVPLDKGLEGLGKGKVPLRRGLTASARISCLPAGDLGSGQGKKRLSAGEWRGLRLYDVRNRLHGIVHLSSHSDTLLISLTNTKVKIMIS